MKVTKEVLEQIAEDLEFGFMCFLHKDTFELVSYPEEGRFPGFDDHEWKDQMNAVKKNRKKFIEIEPISSRQSFIIMADFLDQVDDNSIRDKLRQALEGHKPFANFNMQVADAGMYRERWLKYRSEKNLELIRSQLDLLK